MGSMAVCIVNHNTCDLLRDCLRSVVAEHPDRVVVVDNDSRDGSVAMMEAEFPLTTIITLGGNPGYGAALNRAVQSCHSDYVLLLNSDTVVKAGALATMAEFLDAPPVTALAGPRILNLDGSFQPSCFHFPTPLHMFLYLSGLYRLIQGASVLRRYSLRSISGGIARRVPWVLGAALAVRRAEFEHAGGFDESFFMYFEEVDLCYRLSEGGQKIHFVPAAEVIHVGGASTRQQAAAMQLQYFASLQHFYRKHYSFTRLLALTVIVKLFAFIHLIRSSALLSLNPSGKASDQLRDQVYVDSTLLLGGRKTPANGGQSASA